MQHLITFFTKWQVLQHKKALFNLSQIVLHFFYGDSGKERFFSIHPVNWKHRIHMPLVLMFSLTNFLFLSHRECWFEVERAQESFKSGVWLGKSYNQYSKYAKDLTAKSKSYLDESFWKCELRRQGHPNISSWSPFHWLTELGLQWEKFVEFSFSLRRVNQEETIPVKDADWSSRTGRV